MNFGELRTELRDNILHDRSDRVAGDVDYLWTDATLNRYINEAQRTFARRSLVLRDSSSALTRVTLKEGVDLYELHPDILGIVSARLAEDRRDLERTGNAVIAGHQLPTTSFDPRVVHLGDEPGRPVAFSTDDGFELDEEERLGSIVLRLYPVPSEEYHDKELRLRTIRMPCKLEFDLQEPEIPEQYHITMLDWAAYRALSIVDVDGGMPERADRFLAMFDRHVGEARREALRKLKAPVAMQFGGFGWMWEK